MEGKKMPLKLMKRLVIIGVLMEVAGLIAIIGGAYELSLTLAKTGAMIGFAVALVLLVNWMVSEW